MALTGNANRKESPMAAMFSAPLAPDLFGVPGEDLAPEDFAPELEDCGAGLSDDAVLHWPEVISLD